MIKKILHDDYSGFISADEISSYKNMDSVELIKAISSPFITKSQYYKNSHRFKTEYMLGKSTVVKPSNIKEVLSVKTRIKKGLNETIESLRNVFKGGKTNTYGKSYGVSPQEKNDTQIDEEEER